MPDTPSQAEDVLRAQCRAALRNAALSQAAAARDLGLSAKHMCQMLTGRATLTLPWAERILGLCGARLVVIVQAVGPWPQVDADQLADDSDDPHPTCVCTSSRAGLTLPRHAASLPAAPRRDGPHLRLRQMAQPPHPHRDARTAPDA